MKNLSSSLVSVILVVLLMLVLVMGVLIIKPDAGTLVLSVIGFVFNRALEQALDKYLLPTPAFEEGNYKSLKKFLRILGISLMAITIIVCFFAFFLCAPLFNCIKVAALGVILGMVLCAISKA